MRSWVCRSLSCLALGLVASIAAAADGDSRVALVSAEAVSPTVQRLRAELQRLGVEVVLVKPQADQPVGRVPLEETARGVGAFAAIRVVSSGAGIEVWVADRVTGKTVVREVIVGADEAGEGDDTVAVGAVELLRASLLELNLGRESPAGEVPAPPVARRLAVADADTTRALASVDDDARSYGLTLALGLGPEFGFGGVDASGLGQVLAGWHGRGWFGGAVWLGVGPFLEPAQVRVWGAVAEVSHTTVGLGLSISPPWGTWVPEVAVGPTVSMIGVEGKQAVEPLRVAGGPEYRTEVGGFLRGGLAWEALTNVRFRADLTAFATARSTPIHFAGERVARWGWPPRFAGFLGIEVLVPRVEPAR